MYWWDLRNNHIRRYVLKFLFVFVCWATNSLADDWIGNQDFVIMVVNRDWWILCGRPQIGRMCEWIFRFNDMNGFSSLKSMQWMSGEVLVGDISHSRGVLVLHRSYLKITPMGCPTGIMLFLFYPEVEWTIMLLEIINRTSPFSW
jgi:hypothetical protein